MEFQKVTISLPKGLYERSMQMVNKGMFSSISDMVRSGLREEIKEMEPIMDWERELYEDKELLAGLERSEKDYKEGKGVRFKNKKEMMKHLK